LPAGMERQRRGEPPADYRLVAWLFLRSLALVYLAAFGSLAVQITGLAGSEGIYPIAEQLASAAAGQGVSRFLAYPSVFWLASGDWALVAAAYGGCAAAILLFAGRCERPLLVLLYLLYLSLFHAGQVFTNFQWDYLLLEAGFLAIFLPRGSRVVVWLFRWLLFRLRFLSGISKLTSGDPTWSGLTALSFYFETQPLPHAGAWYAHRLPDWLLGAGTAATLVVEILVPFCMFLPRRWRLFAAWTTILWQLLILLTSNHNFFNLLTIALCLFLFDDQALRRVLPFSWQRRAAASGGLPPQPQRSQVIAALVAAALILPTSLIEAAPTLGLGRPPSWAATWGRWLEPFRIASGYHVFPTIDTERIQVEIAGSMDGKEWRPYRFRYWPDAPDRIPPFAVPHQPRLDWMLWFVPKGPFFLDWFQRFLARLQAGSGSVAGLLAAGPFGDQPPHLVRVDVYRYRFTTPEERAQSGDWWRREWLGPFYPLPAVGRLP